MAKGTFDPKTMKALSVGYDDLKMLLEKICIMWDKTLLIKDLLDKGAQVDLFTRPRRFEKSFMAHMLCAYYDCSCDSHSLFDRYEISKSATYEEHINRYNVIVDVTGSK